MAKAKMMKIRVGKTGVNECLLCNLERDIRGEMEKRLEKIENPISVWNAVEKTNAPGYQVSIFAPGNDGWYTENGYERIRTATICSRCAETLVKCLTRIDDAEEITFSKADSFKDVTYPSESELVQKENENEE